jgi:cytochrome c-type biogenesis protein CcmH/NrfF
VSARAALAVLILAGVTAAAPVRADDAAGWSYQLSNELMSPYCPGRTLPDCPSSQAAELRHWIVDQENVGRSRKEVEAQLVARYGDEILQAPKATGFGLAAYVVPVLLSLAGAALLVVFLRRIVATPAARAGAPPAPLDPELERLVDEELRRR